MDKNLSNTPPKRRRFGDRSDGWRVTSHDAFFSLIPHIMKMRCDSQVFFDQVVEIGELEKFVRNHRRSTSMTELSTLHVVLAAALRMFAEYPCLNRFVSGRRIYARNEIIFSFAIKKDMSLESEESVVKVAFDPTDTLWEVYEKVNSAVKVNKETETQNDTDVFARLMAMCPSWLIRFIVFMIDKLDHLGLLPKALRSFSPFHCSMFLTDVGSLGIGSVYHHLYNFGTCSIFCALGKKGRALKVGEDGRVIYSKTLNLRFTVDERIVDGFYYAYTFRAFLKLLRDPAVLLEKPQNIQTDPGLRKTRKEKRALRNQMPLEETEEQIPSAVN